MTKTLNRDDKSRSIDRTLIYLWIGGFSAALVIQSAFQGWFAGMTAWGRNVGWQTEIALWNAGTICMIVLLLRTARGIERQIISALSFLSLLFGINHFQAALGAPHAWGHWLGAAANFLAVALGLFTLLTSLPHSGQ